MSNERLSTSTPRKSWKKPEVRAMIPAQRTAGGPFAINDQDDPFYSLS